MKHILLLFLAALACAQVGDQRATITMSGGMGDVQIIPAPMPGRHITIRRIVYSASATVNLTYVEGTGTNCGTGRVVLSGALNSVQSIIDKFDSDAPLALDAAQAFCINFSGASTGGGYVIYSN